jgi:hypothetical protein
MSSRGALVGSLFEQPRYLDVAAAELGATGVVIECAGAFMPFLVYPDGSLRTAPGLPRPYGPNLAFGLGELASVLTEPHVRLSATLSPLPGGPELAGHLSVRGARLTGEREICITELGSGAGGAQLVELDARSHELSRATGAVVEVTRTGASHAAFWRDGVAFEEPPDVGEAYLTALARLDHYVIEVYDGDGLAAAALFLYDRREAHLHLGRSRPAPAPVPAIVELALVAGVLEAERRGAALAVLGGGHSDRRDDPLLQRKLAVSGASLPSFTVDVGLVLR